MIWLPSESRIVSIAPDDAWRPYMTTFCVHLPVVGVDVLPPVPMSVPPVIEKVFWSQSKPSSGSRVPDDTMTPPDMVIVPLESIPSLSVAYA